MQVEYIGEPTKQLVIFNCEWFDNTINHGIKVQPQYDIVEINYRRRYSNFDPFIFATNANCFSDFLIWLLKTNYFSLN